MHVPSTWSLDGYFTHFPCTNMVHGKNPQIETTSRKPDLAKWNSIGCMSALTDNGMLHITLKLRLLPSSGFQGILHDRQLRPPYPRFGMCTLSTKI